MTSDTFLGCSRRLPNAAPPAHLGLTPIERFWLAEDVPGTSLSFFHKYLLDEIVEEHRILEALEYVEQRHPFPFCQLTTTSNGQQVWQVLQVNHRQLIKSRSPLPYEGTPPLELAREPGIRLWYTHNLIWFEYHHMSADGRGALQLERDFFARYADEQQDSTQHRDRSASVVNCWASLRHRSRARITLGGAFWRSILAWPYVWRGLKANVLPFPGATPSSTDQVVIEIHTQRLTNLATSKALWLAKTLGISLNDWIIERLDIDASGPCHRGKYS